jgi:glutathione peroxidase
LEQLYQRYKDQGFVVLGFPCDQFGNQEPGDEAEIAQFCSLTYDVTFPMFAKVNVNGDDAHPLFKQLKKAAPGLLGSEGIKWNFTKFLVDPSGKTVKRYAPTDTPASLAKTIETLLPA